MKAWVASSGSLGVFLVSVGVLAQTPVNPAPASTTSTTEVDATSKGLKAKNTEGDVTTEAEVTTKGASVKRQDGDSTTEAAASAEGASVEHRDAKSVTRGELDEKGLRATREALAPPEPTQPMSRPRKAPQRKAPQTKMTSLGRTRSADATSSSSSARARPRASAAAC